MKTPTKFMSVIVFSAAVIGTVVNFAVLPQSIGQETAPTAVTATQPLAERLLGTWKLEEASTPGSPSGIGSRLKMFTATHWCVIQPDPSSGKIVFQHGGRYEVDGDRVKTKTEFAGERTEGMIGSGGVLTIKVEGDTMTQKDLKGVFNETWKRVR